MNYKLSTVKLLLSCFGMYILLGCSEKRLPVKEILEFNVMDITTSVSNIDSCIDKTEIIPLETPESVIIANITKLLLTNNNEIIVFANSGMYKFDSKGKFIMQYGAVGRGPGEYLKIYDICLNNENNELWCLTYLNQVMKYNLANGAFLETIETKSKELDIPTATAIIPSLNDGFYLYVSNPHDIKNIKDDFFC